MKHILITIIAIVSLISCGGAEERKEVNLEKAQQSLNAGDLEKARIELKNVLQIDPNDAQAYFQLGQVFEQQKEFRKAFGNYSKALELAPDNLEFNAKIGTYNLLLAGDIDAAIEKRDFILAKDASNINGLLLKAGILLKQDDTAGAMKITQDIFARKPGHIQNALLLSSLYLKDKKYDESISLLNACIKENPQSRILLSTLAETYYKAGKYDLTESTYKKILENNPEAFMNYLKLAVFYKFTNETEKAEQTLRKAIDADEEDTKRKMALVEFLQQTKSNQAAIEELKSLATKYPQEGDIRIALATMYMSENNLEDAKKILKTAISDFPEDSTGMKAAVHLASIYIQEKKFDAAESVRNDALKISPNDAKLNFVKAKTQLINKDYEGAIISLRIVVKDDPENMEGYFLLSAAHSANGEKQQADEIINRAYENNKANAKGLMALASYYARNKNKDKLEKIVDHYLSINADDYQALSYKSALLNERKMVSEAKPYAIKMIELYPERPNGYIQSVPYMLTENRRDDAVKLLEDGYSKAEENGRILELLVSLYVADENSDLAEKTVQAAIREKGESAELYMLLAKVQWKAGKKEAAEKSLLKASSIKPDWNEPY
ncbi:MAG: tetratricopeptide repeat protein, partial [Gammaproteobacteria bacterium]|nr:tetratricopeptide repeat protein [Gammaproteobacteria bacterium]